MTHYDILEVGPEASAEEIRSAYRKKAIELHPDRVGSHANVAMAQINEAYRVLSDPSLKLHYDLSSGILPKRKPTDFSKLAIQSLSSVLIPMMTLIFAPNSFTWMAGPGIFLVILVFISLVLSIQFFSKLGSETPSTITFNEIFTFFSASIFFAFWSANFVFLDKVPQEVFTALIATSLGNALPRSILFAKHPSVRHLHVVVCSLCSIVIFSLWTVEIPYRIEVLSWLTIPSVAKLLMEPSQSLEAQRW